MLYTIFISCAPNLLLACGALFSENAGVMAIFLEGIINLGAFLFVALYTLTHNLALSAACSIAICTCAIFLVSVFTEKTQANPFLTGIAFNLFCMGFISLISSHMFKSDGVAAPEFVTPITTQMQFTAASAGWATVIFFAWFLQRTMWGLRLRVTGTSPEVLMARGCLPARYKAAAWSIAGCLAAAAGCLLVLKTQAFVPNISSGRGWLALAAVYLGRKHTIGVLAAALFFTVAQYLETLLQGITVLPKSLLLAFPYAVALIMFIFLPKMHTKK